MKQSLLEVTAGDTSINGLVDSFALRQNKRRQDFSLSPLYQSLKFKKKKEKKKTTTSSQQPT